MTQIKDINYYKHLFLTIGINWFENKGVKIQIHIIFLNNKLYKLN